VSIRYRGKGVLTSLIGKGKKVKGKEGRKDLKHSRKRAASHKWEAMDDDAIGACRGKAKHVGAAQGRLR
jgi:hypothetical protein